MCAGSRRENKRIGQLQYTWPMLRQIAPVFFTMDIPATLAYYTGKPA